MNEEDHINSIEDDIDIENSEDPYRENRKIARERLLEIQEDRNIPKGQLFVPPGYAAILDGDETKVFCMNNEAQITITDENDRCYEVDNLDRQYDSLITSDLYFCGAAMIQTKSGKKIIIHAPSPRAMSTLSSRVFKSLDSDEEFENVSVYYNSDYMEDLAGNDFPISRGNAYKDNLQGNLRLRGYGKEVNVIGVNYEYQLITN